MTVAVVGQGSFIGRALKARPEAAGWRFVGWRQALLEDDWLEGVDCLINCAFNDSLKREPYSASRDIDLQLGERLLSRPEVRYLMLSSRMVYGPARAGGRLHEALPTQPVNPYGMAKLHSEEALAALLGDRLTVLRLSNVCGYELEEGRRSFFAMASRSLVGDARIVLDMSPFVERDFLPVEILASWLPQIVSRLRPGLYNLGAGHGTATGRIAQWLIEGHGSGQLLVSDLREHDGFWLDMQRSHEAFGVAGLGEDFLRAYCRALGARLREEGGAAT
ncbi:NAD-dependent epimerase/dehydratase family protein [Pseudomonas sp. Gutcm_11s]|uniref:NAD-dependent epimerase/dehydratase family protein n=1 Tax=Pseudomonas sp. Gutcm_11s TaxID=3026088 RepID=UPI00235EDFCC|nr:NAD(P)-dependent oxidoreductase [Pseudomonas sp. Gutcm_11s]MDD0841202.1 NAD(P)-dependent oxidoreductase [Pseudomonas sp. Gutcm_11s]